MHFPPPTRTKNGYLVVMETPKYQPNNGCVEPFNRTNAPFAASRGRGGEVYQHNMLNRIRIGNLCRNIFCVFIQELARSRNTYKIISGIEYFPFGEWRSPREHHKNRQACEQTFYESRHDHQRTPYLFNGKELDKETGLYYYGARYYDPKISMWYGVDPLAEKFPNMSGYSYAANNPIISLDPDGQERIEEMSENEPLML